MSRQARRIYSFGPFQLDIEEQLLLRDGKAVPLKPKVFELLVVLVQNSGHVVCKPELMKQVWADSFVEESNLTVGISRLRKALGETHEDRLYIETVPRRGYRFVSCVSGVLSESASQSEGYATRIQTEVCATATQTKVCATSGGVRRGTIAVLPFKQMGSVGDEYMGLGMADALITRLSNLRRVTVRPTSSVRKYNGAEDPVLAGKELGVEWVLDGSVQKSGKRMRVTVQLVNIRDEVSLWARKFDERFTNIFDVEDSISDQVAKRLTVKLTRKERKLLAKRYTKNPEAYEAYLKGRYFFGKRTKESLEKAIECFNRAVAIDAAYALAYSGLADCYGHLRVYDALPVQECNSRAERAALRAVELDEELAEAHASLGNLRTRQWNWSAAEKEFEQAIRLNPNYAEVHNWYAVHLHLLGRGDDAFLENERALELDPLSVVFRSTRGKLLYFARRYDLALEQLLKTLDLEPGFGVARYCLALVDEAKGCYDDARVALGQAMTFFGSDPELMAGLGRVHAMSGRRREAVDVIDELTRLSKERYVEPYFLAWIHEALGEKDEAFCWLERICGA